MNASVAGVLANKNYYFDIYMGWGVILLIFIILVYMRRKIFRPKLMKQFLLYHNYNSKILLKQTN